MGNLILPNRLRYLEAPTRCSVCSHKGRMMDFLEGPEGHKSFICPVCKNTGKVPKPIDQIADHAKETIDRARFIADKTGDPIKQELPDFNKEKPI